jgi:hypothetical protein
VHFFLLADQLLSMSSLLASTQSVLHVKETFILTNIAAVTNINLDRHLARIVAGNAGKRIQ